jgi:hypothetical protein
MDMDDDDFMGEIEFDLSPEQQKIVSRAITLASESKVDGDEFMKLNPLISIMQWWEENGTKTSKSGQPPEVTLAEVCRQFILVHEKP